jgi:tRNA-dihydrouridine synthase 3
VANARPKAKGRGGRGGKRGRGNQQEGKEDVEGEQMEWVKQDGLTKKCAFSHNLREYLKTKREDVGTTCPVWKERGWCGSGWRCRWIGSHSKEDGEGELYMVVDEERKRAHEEKVLEERRRKLAVSKVVIGAGDDRPQEWEKEVLVGGFDDPYGEVVNTVPMNVKIQLRKNNFPTKKSEVYSAWVEKEKQSREDESHEHESKEDNRAAYVEAPVSAAEKRRIYIGKETPLLAPLT